MALILPARRKNSSAKLWLNFPKSSGLKTSMEKFKPKGEISRNLEASENRGLEQFRTGCQEQSLYDVIYY